MMLPCAHLHSVRTGCPSSLDLALPSGSRRYRQPGNHPRKLFQGAPVESICHRNGQGAAARQRSMRCQAIVAAPPAGVKPDGQIKKSQPDTDHPIDDKLHHKGPKVLIAGAGIGGLVLAVGLLKRGFDVQVFERNLTAIRGEGKYRGPIQVSRVKGASTYSMLGMQ